MDASDHSTLFPVHVRGAALFVWGTWALMLVAALAFIWRYGPSIPTDDLWTGFIPFVVGDSPSMGEWLWQQEQEHRLPLPKLIILGVGWMFGWDFRGVALLNALFLGAGAAVLTRAARASRGWTCYADAAIPLALLNLGHFDNLLMAWQVQFTLSTALGIVALAMVVWGNQASLGRAIVIAGCLLLLPLCGANGVALVPALAGWLGLMGIHYWRARQPGGSWRALSLWSLAAAALVLVGLYFYHLERSHPPSPSRRAAFGTTLRFLSKSLGEAGKDYWPVSGVLLLALVLSGVVRLAVVWARSPQERLRVIGLSAALAAFGSLALGIGWGRAGWGVEAGFISRYVTLGVPFLCWVLLAWSIPSPSGNYPLVPVCVFVLMCLFLEHNTQVGLRHGREIRDATQAFERDLRAGVPPYLLLRRHADSMFPIHDDLGMMMQRLRQAGIQPFRDMAEDPPFQEIAVPVTPTVSHNLTWDAGQGAVTGRDAYLEFRLPDPQFCAGIRLIYSHASSDHHQPNFQLLWKQGATTEYQDGQRYFTPHLGSDPDPHPVMVWLADSLDYFRIYPDDRPCTFGLSEIVLLLPVPRFYEPGTRVDFSQANQDHLGNGWYEPEESSRWSGPKATFQFRLDRVQPLRLRMMASTFGQQRLTISVNGRDVKTLHESGDARLIELDIPAGAVANDNQLTFTLPDARSPKSMGESEDTRTLGLSLAWLELIPNPSRYDEAR